MSIPGRIRNYKGTFVTQFTAESLGRLIKNVDRETLVAAIRVAKLDAILRSDNIDTIEELQGLFNTAVNLAWIAKPLSKWNSESLESFRSKKKPTEVADVYFNATLDIMIAHAKLAEFLNQSAWDKLFQLPDVIAEFL